MSQYSYSHCRSMFWPSRRHMWPMRRHGHRKTKTGHICPLYLVDMILVFKCLREQAFAADMLFKRRLCVILVEFEGNNKIGLEHTENCSIITTGLPQNGQAVAAVVASPTISPPQDWDIGAQSALLVLCPLVPNLSLLFIVGSWLFVKPGVDALELLHGKLGIAIGALNFLQFAVELKRAAAQHLHSCKTATVSSPIWIWRGVCII